MESSNVGLVEEEAAGSNVSLSARINRFLVEEDARDLSSRLLRAQFVAQASLIEIFPGRKK